MVAMLSMVFSQSPFAATSSADKAGDSVFEEIVVTARMRSENVFDVPDTVSVFTETVIDDAGINRPADFLALTPNVTYVQGADSVGIGFITIRGVSQIRNGESPVAVVVDGVLMSDPGQFNQELYDIQQIEVLKGPQGALYGRNAIGGAINITTIPPSNEPEGKAVLGFGNGGKLRANFTYSAPIIEDELTFRISGSHVESDGLVNNEYLDEKVDFYKDNNVRARMIWTPTDKLSLDLRYGYQKYDGGALNFALQENCGVINGCFASVPEYDPGAADDTSTVITAGRLGDAERTLEDASLKVDYEFDSITLTSITAWNSLDEWYEADAYPYDCGSECPPAYYRIFDTAFGQIPLESLQLVKVFTDVDTISQELRLTSSSDQRLRWIAGLYYLGTERSYALPTLADVGQPDNHIKFDEYTISGFADDNDNKAYAGFGQLNYDVTESVELSFAMRYDRDKRQQTDVAPAEFTSTPGLVRKKTYSQWQPKLTMRYLPTENLNLYANWSQGFRSGGFNLSGVGEAAAAAGIPGIEDQYRKELSNNFELGFKSVLADGRVNLNGALFHTNIDDQQYFQFIGVINAQLISNIDKVTLQGAELGIDFQITDGLTAYAAYGYTDSEIKEYAVTPSEAGNWAPYVARSTFNLGGQYNMAIGSSLQGYARADYEIRGKQFWDTANSSARSAINLLNLRMGIGSNEDTWSVDIWMKNATDEVYNNEYVIGGIVGFGEPRTYGIDFTLRF